MASCTMLDNFLAMRLLAIIRMHMVIFADFLVLTCRAWYLEVGGGCEVPNGHNQLYRIRQ